MWRAFQNSSNFLKSRLDPDQSFGTKLRVGSRTLICAGRCASLQRQRVRQRLRPTRNTPHTTSLAQRRPAAAVVCSLAGAPRARVMVLRSASAACVAAGAARSVRRLAGSAAAHASTVGTPPTETPPPETSSESSPTPSSSSKSSPTKTPSPPHPTSVPHGGARHPPYKDPNTFIPPAAGVHHLRPRSGLHDTINTTVSSRFATATNTTDLPPKGSQATPNHPKQDTTTGNGAATGAEPPNNGGNVVPPSPENDLVALLMRSVAVVARGQNALSTFDGVTLRDALYPPDVGNSLFKGVPSPAAINRMLNNIMISFVNREYESIAKPGTPINVSELHGNPSMDPDRIRHLIMSHPKSIEKRGSKHAHFKMDELSGFSSIPTPPQIRAHLDKFVIGQDDMKRSIAVAVYQHYIRTELSNQQKNDTSDSNTKGKGNSNGNNTSGKRLPRLQKNNVLILGPTGTGKTLVTKTVAELLNVPFSVNDATTLTEAGYVGEDVEVCLSRLLSNAKGDVAAAERGIVFIDEIDKLASLQTSGRDVSGTSVQQGLLGLLEARKVNVPIKNGRAKVEIDTANILFILSGAFPGLESIIARRVAENSFGFHAKETVEETRKKENVLQMANTEDLRKFGLIPEFVGRIPIITATKNLTEEELMSILVTPVDSIVSQFQTEFAAAGLELYISKGALREFAKQAKKLGTGARGLRNLLFTTVKPYLYDYARSKYRYVALTSKVVNQTLESKTTVQSDPSIVFKANQREDAMRLLAEDQDPMDIGTEKDTKPETEKTKTDTSITITPNDDDGDGGASIPDEDKQDRRHAASASTSKGSAAVLSNDDTLKFNNFYGPSMQILSTMGSRINSDLRQLPGIEDGGDGKKEQGRKQTIFNRRDKPLFNWKAAEPSVYPPTGFGMKLNKVQEARVPLMELLKSLDTQGINKLVANDAKSKDVTSNVGRGRNRRGFPQRHSGSIKGNNATGGPGDIPFPGGFNPSVLGSISKYMLSGLFDNSDLYLAPGPNKVTIVRGTNEFHDSFLSKMSPSTQNLENTSEAFENEEEEDNDVDSDTPEPDMKGMDSIADLEIHPIMTSSHILGSRDSNDSTEKTGGIKREVGMTEDEMISFLRRVPAERDSSLYGSSKDGKIDAEGYLIPSSANTTKVTDKKDVKETTDATDPKLTKPTNGKPRGGTTTKPRTKEGSDAADKKLPTGVTDDE